MRVGTKSVIFGVHSILAHPFFVAWAWWRLYGFPWDGKLWLAFLLHDAGYFRKADMEGDQGQRHVVLGGRIMGWLFGQQWRDFVLCHSRHWARRAGKRYSKPCVADKLAFVLTPSWLYVPMAGWSGELAEYMRVASARPPVEKRIGRRANRRAGLQGVSIMTRNGSCYRCANCGSTSGCS